MGGVTPVKDQGNCGSCGEFAAVAVLEALIKKETGLEVDLSEQQIVSCVPGCGCNSGCSSLRALEYIKENAIALKSDFPYLEDTICISDLDAKYFICEVFSITIGKMPIIPGSADHARPVKGLSLHSLLWSYKGLASIDYLPDRSDHRAGKN